MHKVYVKKISNLKTDLGKLLDIIELNKLFHNGETVIIKPNFIAPRKSYTGATTNLTLIKELVKILHQMKVYPILLETPGMEFDIETVFSYLGIKEFSQKIDLPIYIPKDDDYINIPIPNAEILHFVKIPKMVLDSKIINLPVLKTHVITKITASMKNIMGFCHDDTKRKMHILGINRCIKDLNKLIKPDLTIIDALTSMDGDGAVYGNAKQTNFLLAGKNSFSLDKIACDIIGIDYKKVDYLKISQDNEEIDLIGDRIKFTFQLPEQGKLYQFAYRLLYFLDIIFFPLFKTHFNEFLYKTGFFGTHPKIINQKTCAQCRKCIEICPVNAISKNYKINYKKCIRCLNCYEICQENRIIIKGFSKPENYEKK